MIQKRVYIIISIILVIGILIGSWMIYISSVTNSIISVGKNNETSLSSQKNYDAASSSKKNKTVQGNTLMEKLHTEGFTVEKHIKVLSPQTGSAWKRYEIMEISWSGDSEPVSVYVVSRSCFESKCLDDFMNGKWLQPLDHMLLGDYKRSGFSWRVSSLLDNQTLRVFPAGEYKLLFHRSAEGGKLFLSKDRLYFGESGFFRILDENSPHFKVEDWMFLNAKH
jgi:hypothetical protein